MIGPSPDWFVGISGRSLLDGSGRWVPRLEVDLFPYDAGTEEGAEFSLDNPPTDPQGAITSIRGTGKFSNERMAGLTIVRREAPAPTVRLRASPNPVAEGGSVTVTATLSRALAGGVTIPLTLTAGTAEPGDYGSLAGIAIDGGSTIGTGAVTTTNDVDEDDETFTVALGSLPSSVAAGSPSSVEVTIRDEGPVAVPGLTFSSRRVTVTEGSTAAYEVALDAAPSPSVTVSVDSGDTGAATVSPASLDFTTSNWRTPQQVTVTGVQDADAMDEAVTVTHGGTGGDHGDGHRTGGRRRHGPAGAARAARRDPPGRDARRVVAGGSGRGELHGAVEVRFGRVLRRAAADRPDTLGQALGVDERRGLHGARPCEQRGR